MNKETYLKKLLNRFNVSDDDIEILMINQKINGKEYVADDVDDLKMAVYHEFSRLLPLADISEGDYSVKWNTEAFRMWYSALANELGMDDILNQDNSTEINDRSFMF